MASGNTMITIDGLLKQYYDDGMLVNETYKKHPLWGMITKQQDLSPVTGRAFVHPIVYASSQGRATNFGLAQSSGNATGELSVDFTVTRVRNYQVASVSTETVLSTQNDRGAFTKAVTLITDNCLNNLGLDQAQAMYGDGSGQRGNLSAGTNVATSTLTLAVSQNVVNFEVGMQLDLAATVGGAVKAYGTAGHGLYVIGVNRTSGVLTIGTTPNPATATPVAINDATNGIPTAAAGDFIFCRGDQNTKMMGLAGWIPYGGPSATPFFGVDRTTDSVRLAGNWLDATQLSIEDAFITAVSNVALQGHDLTHFLMPYNKYSQLLKSQSSKVTIIDEVAPGVSFEGVEVLTPSGKVSVFPDRDCPPDRIWGLDMKSWEYTHLADPVQVWNLDGNTWLRQTGDDGMEIRFFSMGNLVCRVPAANINIKVNP